MATSNDNLYGWGCSTIVGSTASSWVQIVRTGSRRLGCTCHHHNEKLRVTAEYGVLTILMIMIIQVLIILIIILINSGVMRRMLHGVLRTITCMAL
jgi:hypothetical protein